MDLQQDFNFQNNFGVTQKLTIAGIGLAWAFFIVSSFNYQNESWFPFLLGTRIFLLLTSGALLLFLSFRKTQYERWEVDYLTLCLCIQALHGILETPTSAEFHSFTGIIFIFASLAYRGTLKIWIRWYLPFQYLYVAQHLLKYDRMIDLIEEKGLTS